MKPMSSIRSASSSTVKIPDMLQMDIALVDQVKQAAGSVASEDIDALLQGLYLRMLGHAAEDDCMADAGKLLP